MFNIFSNALKFTANGSITLKVFSINSESPKLRISIIDTGIGISQENIGKLFTAFGMLSDGKEYNK